MADTLKSDRWELVNTDCIEHMHDMPPASVDMSVFSPPFPALYAYTDSEADLGNIEDLTTESQLHFGFFFSGLRRVLKPGRVVIVHCTPIPRMKRVGGIGMHDFPGMLIRLGERAGLVYDYSWTIRKNPQSQALRTKSRELQFSGLEADRSRSRGAVPDYLLKFRAPGENAVPVDSKRQVSREDWIAWAEPAWMDIRETDTLNVRGTKGADDVKHICLGRGSLVLTYDGYKPIEDVSVGDEVLTHLGRWRPVIAKVCNGVRTVVRSEAQGVPGLVTTPDHRLWARSCVGRGGKGWEPGSMNCQRKNAMTAQPEWMPAEKSKGSYVNLKLPPVKDSPYTADEWWLVGRWLGGRWLGDGHLDARGRVHISCAYQETEALVSAVGERAGYIGRTTTGNQVSIKDRDGRIRKLISRFGRFCDGKKVTGEALSLDVEKSEALLSGYLSADGHYTEQYQRWTASSISRPLLLGMAMVAQRARGVVASVFAGRPPGTTVIEGRTVNTAQEWILSIPPQNVSAMMLDDGAWKKVRRVDDAGEAEVWDIQVAEDESFTAEGCIVHNCPLQLEVIRRCVLLYSNPGELVFSPFAGIGSEGYVALREGRRFYGTELKGEYFREAARNLTSVLAKEQDQPSLFGAVG